MPLPWASKCRPCHASNESQRPRLRLPLLAPSAAACPLPVDMCTVSPPPATTVAASLAPAHPPTVLLLPPSPFPVPSSSSSSAVRGGLSQAPLALDLANYDDPDGTQRFKGQHGMQDWMVHDVYWLHDPSADCEAVAYATCKMAVEPMQSLM